MLTRLDSPELSWPGPVWPRPVGPSDPGKTLVLTCKLCGLLPKIFTILLTLLQILVYNIFWLIIMLKNKYVLIEYAVFFWFRKRNICWKHHSRRFTYHGVSAKDLYEDPKDDECDTFVFEYLFGNKQFGEWLNCYINLLFFKVFLGRDSPSPFLDPSPASPSVPRCLAPSALSPSILGRLHPRFGLCPQLLPFNFWLENMVRLPQKQIGDEGSHSVHLFQSIVCRQNIAEALHIFNHVKLMSYDAHLPSQRI